VCDCYLTTTASKTKSNSDRRQAIGEGKVDCCLNLQEDIAPDWLDEQNLLSLDSSQLELQSDSNDVSVKGRFTNSIHHWHTISAPIGVLLTLLHRDRKFNLLILLLPNTLRIIYLL
jgi:hypothetical protein